MSSFRKIGKRKRLSFAESLSSLGDLDEGDSDYNVRVVIDIDLESGEYSTVFKNLANPGKSLDFIKINNLLKKVFLDIEKRADCDGTS